MAIRNVRRDEIHRVTAGEGRATLPTDDAKALTHGLQKITETQIERVDDLAPGKRQR